MFGALEYPHRFMRRTRGNQANALFIHQNDVGAEIRPVGQIAGLNLGIEPRII